MGISSLDVLAMNAPVDIGAQICVTVDARRNLVYSCVYRRTEKGLEKVNEYSLTGMEEVLKKIKAPAFFIGDGIGLYREMILERSSHSLLAPEKSWYPKASHLAKLAYPLFLKKKFFSVDKIVPLYLYPEDCQIKKI